MTGSRLLKNSSKREIAYRKQFACHEAKFKITIDYLFEHNQQKCLLRNNEGNFDIVLIVDFKARLSFFYSDFGYTNNNSKDMDIISVPIVDESMLKDAIDILENVVNHFYKIM